MHREDNPSFDDDMVMFKTLGLTARAPFKGVKQEEEDVVFAYNGLPNPFA